MPEGDTVWRTARQLDRALSGTVLTGCDIRVPAYATADFTGLEVVETVSRGKHLLTRIGDDWTLHTHLKMEGSWHLYRPGSRWRRPDHQARAVLRTQEWTAVGFSLGITEVVARDQEASVVGHLGPDLLGADWDPAEALARLRAAPERTLGEALLDQRNLAGIGNLYANELCFLAGRTPWAPVADVPDLGRLVDRAHLLLEANKDRVEQVTTGDLRRSRQHWVYRRERRACLRCGTTIQYAELAGRATYWCPSCQSGPVPG